MTMYPHLRLAKNLVMCDWDGNISPVVFNDAHTVEYCNKCKKILEWFNGTQTAFSNHSKYHSSPLVHYRRFWRGAEEFLYTITECYAYANAYPEQLAGYMPKDSAIIV